MMSEPALDHTTGGNWREDTLVDESAGGDEVNDAWRALVVAVEGAK